MQAIEFNSCATGGLIKIPKNYQDWYGQPITVILLRKESTGPIEPKSADTASKPPRPIGLAKDKFQVSADFFDELPAELLDAFEGK
jgi:hypothetical protein